MGAWSATSITHVAHMSGGDFFGSEQSATLASATNVRIDYTDADGKVTVLKENIPLLAGEVIDASIMSKNALREFLAVEINDAREQGVLLSLHLKATMMKVSDPIIFGHAVTVFYEEVFSKYGVVFSKLGIDPNNGIGDVYSKIQSLPDAERAAIEADITACYSRRPELAMVDSDRGITNLHVPSDVIVNAGSHTHIRADVGTRRPAPRYEGDYSRSMLRRCLPGGGRFLQG
jgi:isocitrate dehydrogenase